jgi:hypothetical protein
MMSAGQGGMVGNAGEPSVGGEATAGGMVGVAGEPSDTAGAAGAAGAGGAPDPGPSCTGTPPVCNTLNDVQCALVAGCGAAAESCAGTPPACSTYLSAPLCAQATGCAWNGACTGTPLACADRDNQIACSNGCTWTPCDGTATACTTYTDSTTCELQSNCTWQ